MMCFLHFISFTFCHLYENCFMPVFHPHVT